MDLFGFRERHIPHTEYGPPQRVSAARNVVWLAFIGWVVWYANEWEDYSIYFGEGGGDFQELGHSLVFWQRLETVMVPLGVSFHLLIEDQGLVLSAILVPCDSNPFMLCPWAMSFFQKLCTDPFPPVTTRLRLSHSHLFTLAQLVVGSTTESTGWLI